MTCNDIHNVFCGIKKTYILQTEYLIVSLYNILFWKISSSIYSLALLTAFRAHELSQINKNPTDYALESEI